MSVMEVQGDSENEDFLACDVAYIVYFCIHDIGILKPQLTPNKLKKIGCIQFEMKAFVAYLENKSNLHDESNQGKTTEVDPSLSTLQ